MKILIKGDADQGFNGIFKAVFKNENESFSLSFDLDNWVNEASNGIISRNKITIIKPELMVLDFDQEYEFKTEVARKIFVYLKYNGWKEGD